MEKFKLKNGDFIKIRRIKKIDFNRGFLETLSSLNPIPLTPEIAKNYFQIIKKNNPNTFIYVAIIEEDKVIGTISLSIDQKFGGKIGRIEDVATREEYMGLGVSSAIHNVIISKAKEMGCYKLILSCKNDLIGFYEKLGFEKEQYMLKMSLK